VGALIVAQFIPLAHTFWAFYALAILTSILSSALGTLVDGVTLAMLGSKSENYGRYRIGGSIGYILASSTSGFIYDRTGLGLIFPTYGVLMALFAVIALLLPNIAIKIEHRAESQIGAMIRQPAWVIFAACVFLVCRQLASIVPGRFDPEPGRQPKHDRDRLHIRGYCRNPFHGFQRLVHPAHGAETPDGVGNRVDGNEVHIAGMDAFTVMGIFY
jgi:MFS family permease